MCGTDLLKGCFSTETTSTCFISIPSYGTAFDKLRGTVDVCMNPFYSHFFKLEIMYSFMTTIKVQGVETIL